MKVARLTWWITRYGLLFIFCFFVSSYSDFALSGTLITKTFPADPVQLRNPGSLAVGGDGTVYVVDGYRDRVQVFGNSGNYIGTVPVSRPSAVAVASDGTLYIGSHRDYSVIIVKDGKHAGALGNGIGEFSSIRDIAVDQATGDVYVADAVANTVRVYYNSGMLKSVFGVFHAPAGIAVSDQAVYVLDAPIANADGTTSTGSRISLLGRDGTLLSRIEQADASGSVIKRPSDIAVDRSGRIYVSDTAQNIVLMYAGTGAYLGSIESASGDLSRPVSLALSPDGILYVSSSDTGRIVQVEPGSLAFSAGPLSIETKTIRGAIAFVGALATRRTEQ